jgi:hypothetical protein
LLKSHSVRAQKDPDVQSAGAHKLIESPASNFQLLPGGVRMAPVETFSPIQIGYEFWFARVTLVAAQVAVETGCACWANAVVENADNRNRSDNPSDTPACCLRSVLTLRM